MKSYLDKINHAADYIQRQTNFEAKYGIILGTGLGNLVNDIEVEHEIEYQDIPHFPTSTVETHKGKLIFGQLENQPVICMQGRFHFYEGYDMKQVTFPVRVMKLLGINQVFISNVSGSVQDHLNEGDLMIIKDHIYLQTENPLTGLNLDDFGPRFPDMSEPYSQRLSAKAMEIAKANGFACHYGTYASVPGPNLETKAEYRYLHVIGADAVGMSTAPEVIVAVHCGMEVCAISVITDKNFPFDTIGKVNIQEILRIAYEAEPKLTAVVKGLISSQP
ncbi:UNVERIFIED_CONTAM: hypothetical protein GTU68_062096 [Idotea baltica]|nr:hypothetical protein [Idotea baltica]